MKTPRSSTRNHLLSYVRLPAAIPLMAAAAAMACVTLNAATPSPSPSPTPPPTFPPKSLTPPPTRRWSNLRCAAIRSFLIAGWQMIWPQSTGKAQMKTILMLIVGLMLAGCGSMEKHSHNRNAVDTICACPWRLTPGIRRNVSRWRVPLHRIALESRLIAGWQMIRPVGFRFLNAEQFGTILAWLRFFRAPPS